MNENFLSRLSAAAANTLFHILMPVGTTDERNMAMTIAMTSDNKAPGGHNETTLPPSPSNSTNQTGSLAPSLSPSVHPDDKNHSHHPDDKNHSHHPIHPDDKNHSHPIQPDDKNHSHPIHPDDKNHSKPIHPDDKNHSKPIHPDKNHSHHSHNSSSDSNDDSSDDDGSHHSTYHLSFWGIVRKTIAWMILIALSVVAFGACMTHRYRIYFFLRGVWYTVLRMRCTQFVLHKIHATTNRMFRGRGSSSTVNGELNTVMFDNELSEGLMLNENQED